MKLIWIPESRYYLVPLLQIYILVVHEYQEQCFQSAHAVLPGRQKFRNVKMTKLIRHCEINMASRVQILFGTSTSALDLVRA